METVTIDNLNIRTHKRWAEDQARIDPNFLEESAKVSPATEVTGTSSIFASRWASLFGIDIRHLPWAGFTPPAKFNMQAKRFFSYRIIPSLTFPLDSQDEGEDEEKQRKNRLKTFLQAHKGNQSDKEILNDLLDTIFNLDDLLGTILVKKLQYQKG